MRHPIVINFLAALVLGGFFFWCLSFMPVRACERMTASYYGTESCATKHCITANGENFTGRAMTAAHRSYPFGTKLRVTYQGKSVVVRVNDRGPFVRGRSLDLSKSAARKLGMIPAGVASVCVERLD